MTKISPCLSVCVPWALVLPLLFTFGHTVRSPRQYRVYGYPMCLRLCVLLGPWSLRFYCACSQSVRLFGLPNNIVYLEIYLYLSSACSLPIVITRNICIFVFVCPLSLTLSSFCYDAHSVELFGLPHNILCIGLFSK